MKLSYLRRPLLFYTALAGFLLLVGIQVVWLGNTYRLKEREFDESVKNTLRFYNNDFQDNPVLQQAMKGLWTKTASMEQVNPTLRQSFDTCFRNNGLPANYVFSLGVNKKEPLWISDNRYRQQLHASGFSIIALCMADAGAFQLKFFFPGKHQSIVTALMPLLLLSGFTLLVLLACFISLLYLLRKQDRLSQVKQDFLNNMTHELKTPLFTISIASRMLDKKAGTDPARHPQYIRSIQQEVQRLNGLVDHMLQAAVLEQQGIALPKKTINLHEAILKAVEGFALICEENKGEIITDLQAVQCYIDGNETHLVQTVYNLLDNAFKYTTEPPRIVLSTRNEGKDICFSIKDNGIGIDPPTQALLFERFFRAHTGDVHTIKGYGIGLSYVKSVVEAHNGLIRVNSRLQQGSEFILQIPYTNP
jgi:two-component system phosphate regulon sensor histidine kinase PhoR